MLLNCLYSPYFKRTEGDNCSILVIIQCDSGHANGDLIACARNRIYDARSEKEGETHIVFVIHLPHQAANSSFVGFQGDPWISVHIDDLRPTSDSTIMPYEAMDSTISQLFLGSVTPSDQFCSLMDQGGAADMDNEESDVEMDSKPSKPLARPHQLTTDNNEGESMDEDELPLGDERMSEGSDVQCSEEEIMEEEHPASTGIVSDELPHPVTLLPPQCRRLHGCIQAAASKLQDDNKRRATERVEILVNLIPKDITISLGEVLNYQ